MYAYRHLKTNMNTIEALVSDFTNKLTAAIQTEMRDRLQAALSGTFVAEKKRGRGRPPKAKKAVAAAASAAPKDAASKRPRKPISPKRAATMARQGKYMALLRQLKGGNLAKVRAVAKKDGVEAALVLGNSYLK
jgi:nucleoid DNA-binding protein